MQTLYGIHVNNVDQVSVDVFNDRRPTPYKWRAYFAVSPASIARLRRVYAAHPKAFYVSRGWSPARWKMYKHWYTAWTRKEGAIGLSPSLDTLETKFGGPGL
jgi:hypothetical protein